jgi:hypothetical protein
MCTISTRIPIVQLMTPVPFQHEVSTNDLIRRARGAGQQTRARGEQFCGASSSAGQNRQPWRWRRARVLVFPCLAIRKNTRTFNGAKLAQLQAERGVRTPSAADVEKAVAPGSNSSSASEASWRDLERVASSAAAVAERRGCRGSWRADRRSAAATVRWVSVQWVSRDETRANRVRRRASYRARSPERGGCAVPDAHVGEATYGTWRRCSWTSAACQAGVSEGDGPDEIPPAPYPQSPRRAGEARDRLCAYTYTHPTLIARATDIVPRNLTRTTEAMTWGQNRWRERRTGQVPGAGGAAVPPTLVHVGDHLGGRGQLVHDIIKEIAGTGEGEPALSEETAPHPLCRTEAAGRTSSSGRS